MSDYLVYVAHAGEAATGAILATLTVTASIDVPSDSARSVAVPSDGGRLYAYDAPDRLSGPADGRTLRNGQERELAEDLKFGGPVVIVRDNLNSRVSASVKRYIEARCRLAVFQLPPYATEFSPVEA